MTAERAQEALTKILESTPEGHQDRRFLSGLLEATVGYNLISQPPAELEKPAEVHRNLVKETFDLLGNLRGPTNGEREIFVREGFVFLTVEAKSLGQFVEENAEYFGHVNPSAGLRAYTPPQNFEIAINYKQVRVPQSNNSSQEEQLRMIEEYSKDKIEKLIPSARAIMLPATAYAQADFAFQKIPDSQLLTDFWARALDTTVESSVAHVGRGHPDGPLGVGGWCRDDGFHLVWAVPAVVFPRK